MSTYQTPAEAAADIRKALKAKGWSSRDVSVRAHSFSMGSSIDVHIKNSDVPFRPVSDIANGKEKIDRDQFGEILSGCNRYVHVSYDHVAMDVLVARYIVRVRAALDTLKAASDNAIVPIGDTPFGVSVAQNYSGFSVWGRDTHVQVCYDDMSIARCVAVEMQGVL